MVIRFVLFIKDVTWTLVKSFHYFYKDIYGNDEQSVLLATQSYRVHISYGDKDIKLYCLLQ